MSFGWPFGDLVAALQLVNKVAVTLKDIGGASSHYQDITAFLNVLAVTLQHLRALQAAPLDHDLAKNIEEHCAQIQGPLTSFRERIHSRFDRDLGLGSTRPKLLTAGRKLQWAFSTSKDVKELENKIGRHIAAIGVVLNQQVIQTTLQMPMEIQARLAHTIDTAVDTRISPFVSAVHKEVAALSKSEKASSRLIEDTFKAMGRQNAADIKQHTQILSAELEDKFNALSISQRSYAAEDALKIEDRSRLILEAVGNQAAKSRTDPKSVQEMISTFSTRQSQTPDIVLRTVRQESQEATREAQRHFSAARQDHLDLHKKLDHMGFLMSTVKDHMGSLFVAQQSARSSATNSELKKAMKNLQRAIWPLLSALHVLIRELIYFLVPYLVALYRTSIQPLLRYGDHFLFEDAIGRRKWLPCLQFQHWENFYSLLVETFQGEVGLSRVLNGQFIILNAFNETPIHKKAWRAGIQPKSRITMAILLGSAAVTRDRCANPACPGQVDFGQDDITRVCPICGKHLSKLKDSLSYDDDLGSETAFSFNFGSDIKIPILNESPDIKTTQRETGLTSARNKTPWRGKSMRYLSSDKDVAAYKRVIWEDIDDVLYKVESQAHIQETEDWLSSKNPSRNFRLQRSGRKVKTKTPKSYNYGDYQPRKENAPLYFHVGRSTESDSTRPGMPSTDPAQRLRVRDIYRQPEDREMTSDVSFTNLLHSVYQIFSDFKRCDEFSERIHLLCCKPSRHEKLNRLLNSLKSSALTIDSDFQVLYIRIRLTT